MDDIVEMLPLEVKKPPIFVANGAAIGLVRVDGDEESDPVPLEAGLAVVSALHILQVPTGAGPSLESRCIAGSVFHILNAPHPVEGFFVSASSPVVMVGIGGSFTDSDCVIDDCVSEMKSRKAFAHVSEASWASLASDNSCLVSSSSALTVFISRRRASNSSTRGSLGGVSNDSGGDVRPKIPEKRLELMGG